MEDEKRKPVEIMVEIDEPDGATVRGRITALTVEWEVKRGQYNSETLRGYAKFEPENLHLEMEFEPGEADLLRSMIHRLSDSVDAGIRASMGNHLEAIHTPPPEPKGGVRIGGDGGNKTNGEVETY